MSIFRTTILQLSFPTIANVGRQAAPSAVKMMGPRAALTAFRLMSDAKKGAPVFSKSSSPNHPKDKADKKTAHPRLQELCETEHELSHHLHPIWTPEELNAVEVTHLKPQKFVDKAAYWTVQAVRQVYDIATGYKFGKRNEMCYIRRIIFLETVAGVPGMVGAMVRHCNSLRRMERDYGWIHTLLEEAENERMHLMTAMLLLDKPGFIIRYSVIGAQWAFLTWYTIMYLLSPKYCHRFVGYIEEEAVKTYTGMVQAIDRGELPKFIAPAHPTAMAYWQLPPNATLRDVILCIRADETHHREVNHTFADMQRFSVNPFLPGY